MHVAYLCTRDRIARKQRWLGMDLVVILDNRRRLREHRAAPEHDGRHAPPRIDGAERGAMLLAHKMHKGAIFRRDALESKRDP